MHAPSLARDRWRDRVYSRYYRAPNHRGKWRIEAFLRRIFGLSEVVAPSPDGVRFALQLQDMVQEHMLRTGSYEPESLALMRRLLRPGDVMVDVGAHVGEYGLHASPIVGRDGKVVMVEANPRTYQLLLRNIVLNNFANVSPLLGAVGATEAVVPMSFPAETNWGATHMATAASDRAFYVAALDLGAALSQMGVASIGLLKLDVEGVEGAVLRALDLASPLRPRAILLEFIPELIVRMGDSPRAVLALLRDAGYAISDVRGAAITETSSLVEENVLALDSRQPVVAG